MNQWSPISPGRNTELQLTTAEIIICLVAEAILLPYLVLGTIIGPDRADLAIGKFLFKLLHWIARHLLHAIK